MDFIDFFSTILTSDAFAAIFLTAFAGAVASAVGAVIYFIRKRVLKDLDAAELEQLRIIADQAVRFAEQVYKTAGGDVKLAAAMEAADKMLASYGIKVTTAMLRTVIEAAVYTALAAEQPAGPVDVNIVAPPPLIEV